ncbi:MAG: hypothetical protein QNJ68_03755 [Microcoleaceae cyanobacterium MO_207.B10]|nr:hypothetical protein [Microcoleaceae cyanobacterium MO_207.B10]
MSKTPRTPDSSPTNNFPIVVPIGLGLLMLGLSWRLFVIITFGSAITWLIRYYYQQQQQQQACLNATFYQLIQENQGHITALDLAISSQLPGKVVQEFLEERSKEFGAELEITDQGGFLYFFPTAVSLISSQKKEAEIYNEKSQQLEDSTQLVSEEIIDTFSSHSNPQIQQNHPHITTNKELSQLNQKKLQNNPFHSSPQVISLSLSQKELASRLKVHTSTISKRKTKPDFAQWSSQKDPESISWEYSQELARFSPKIPKS